MLIHCGSSQEVDSLFQKDYQLVINLCFSSYAEVLSNSALFGGKDSISFKIKMKKVIQRIKQVKKLLKEKS